MTPNRSPRGSRLVLAVLFLGLTLGGCDNMFPSSNWHGGEDNCAVVMRACQADGPGHSFLSTGINGVVYNGFHAAMAGLDVATDMADINHNAPGQYVGSAGNNAETDVRAGFDPGAVQGTEAAYQYCEDVDNAPTRKCDQAYINFRYDNICADFGSSVCNWQHFWQSISCHEIGHSVGLLHGGDATPEMKPKDDVLGCMRNGASPNDLDPLLGSHNSKHINDTY